MAFCAASCAARLGDCGGVGRGDWTLAAGSGAGDGAGREGADTGAGGRSGAGWGGAAFTCKRTSKKSFRFAMHDENSNDHIVTLHAANNGSRSLVQRAKCKTSHWNLIFAHIHKFFNTNMSTQF